MRIALFGGTFDPIHRGHLEIARAAADHYALDEVVFIPAGNPPHKSGRTQTPYKHRLRMVELACAGEPRFVVSRLEEGAGVSYSIDTIAKVKQMFPQVDQLYFLIGADAFAEIQTWRRWREVIAEIEFLVVSRPGHTYEIPEGAVVHRLETLHLEVSSSEMRRLLRSGQGEENLPPAVWEYIRTHGLYREA